MKYWLFNWDDPYNFRLNEFDLKAKYFDCVFITSLGNVNNYLAHGAKQAIYSLPGYDPSYYYPIDNIEYKYDISIVLTNLYSDSNLYPDQITNRHNLVSIIYNGQIKYNYKFAIFLVQNF